MLFQARKQGEKKAKRNANVYVQMSQANSLSIIKCSHVSNYITEKNDIAQFSCKMK